MRSRMILAGHGGPEVLEVVERDAPAPARGEVRIAVEAAGVAYGDVMRRRGLLGPGRRFIPGYDVVGRIDMVGDGADEGLVGARVAAMMPRVGSGGYADHTCVPAERIARVPPGVAADAAVCLGLNYITALQMMRRALGSDLAGKRVLIHGAAGGVGTALLDLGRAAGLRMIGRALHGKEEVVRAAGARWINSWGEDFVARVTELTGDGVDAVFDGIGGDNLSRSYRTLRPGGALVAFGVSSASGMAGMAGWLARIVALKLRPGRRRVHLYLITVSRGAGWRQCRDDWADLLARCARGELRPIVGARIPLAEAARAHELLERRALAGKIVLTAASWTPDG
jgi:NADPH:quinone reductase-like Zn-dependent oxidoreductase